MIEAQKLTAEAFAPFGHVSRSGEGEAKRIRDGQVLLTKTDARFSHSDEAVDFALDFYEVGPERGQLNMTTVERHPNSSQSFLPVDVARYLIVVWPGEPDATEPKAFIAGPGDVITYNPGVWHHGIVSLDCQGLFASTMWRTRGGVDTEFRKLDVPLSVSWQVEAV